MADPADIANDYADEFLLRALNARSQAVAQVQAGSLECEDCDAVIPQARREALPFCSTCVDCQSIRERKA
jgi:phage/conjugal plasmid C-4 type zinc finger TraR family protein